jgi:hypothetical protein
MPSEFEIIRRFFSRPARNAPLGVGDDAALLKPAAGFELAVSTDLLIVGPGDLSCLVNPYEPYVPGGSGHPQPAIAAGGI